MKKLASLLLALVMIMSCFSAMAYTITIENTTTGHTYEAYQIFAGDLSNQAESDTSNGTNAVLSNITWGNGVDGAALLAELKTVDPFTACTDAVTVAEKLHESKNSSTVVKAFAAIVAKHLTNVATTSGTYDANNKSYTISGLDAGYYLVKDQDGSVTGNEAYTRFIIEVVENSTVATKSAVPSSEKKVQDTNDSVANSTTGWQDSADYDIGDDVPFQLTGTVASNYADYKVYKFIFHDKLSAGLTFNNDVKVYVDGVEITTGYTVVTEGFDDGCTFEVRFADLKQIAASVNAGSKITVEYTAKLNEGADVGTPGNNNTMHLEYSNNPNNAQDGEQDTGNTPDDTVAVFTYELDVDKIDKDNNPLKGAGFTLYKWKEVEKTEGETITKTFDWVAVSEEIKDEDLTTFVFKGLDDGKYKLVETTTPVGYNTIAPIEFEITATHSTTVTELNVTPTDADVQMNADANSGVIETDVVNNTGSTLPETGGMGTTILYVGGGILVLAAIVLLIAKRRTAA